MKSLTTLLLAITLILGTLHSDKARAGLMINPAIGVGTLLMALGAGLTIAGGTAIGLGTNLFVNGPHRSTDRERATGLVISGPIMMLVGVVLIALPAEGNSFEITELDYNNLPPGISEDDAEIFNFWSTPLSNNSRTVLREANLAIATAADPTLYDSEQELKQLMLSKWESKLIEMNMPEEEKRIVKKVFEYQLN